MRWLAVVFVSLALILFCSVICSAAETMRPYSLVRDDMDTAIADQMAKTGIVENKTLEFLAKKLKSSYGFAGSVEAINDPLPNARISPSNIYVNSGLIRQCKTDGELMGVVLCMYFHIANGDLGDRYDQVARNYNAFAIGSSKAGPGYEENLALMKKIAVGVVEAFTQKCILKADSDTWNAMAGFGYSANEYLALLERLNANWRSTTGPFLITLSNRIVALKKLGPAPEVTNPAKSMEDERAKFEASIEITDRFEQIDPTPFLAVMEKRVVPGYCCREIEKRVFLFFDRGGKLACKNGNWQDVPGSPENPGEIARVICLDDGPENVAKEAVLLVHNPSKQMRYFFLKISLGAEVGVAGLGEAVSTIGELKSVGWKWARTATTDKPNEWLAVRFKVSDITRKTYFGVVATTAEPENRSLIPTRYPWDFVLLR